MSHFGATKLYLLSTLSESEQEKITAENDVESMTVKQLEAQVKKLKEENEELEKAVDNSDSNLTLAKSQIKHLEEEKQSYQTTIDEQAEHIREMENRPIEVAVAEPSDDVRRLQETIKNLQRTTDEQLDRVQEEHLAEERRLRQELGADKQAAIDAITKEYEAKLAAAVQPAAGESDDKQVFKAYFSAAYDTFNRMLAFAKASPNKEFFREKINKLITTLETSTGTM